MTADATSSKNEANELLGGFSLTESSALGSNLVSKRKKKQQKPLGI